MIHTPFDRITTGFGGLVGTLLFLFFLLVFVQFVAVPLAKNVFWADLCTEAKQRVWVGAELKELIWYSSWPDAFLIEYGGVERGVAWNYQDVAPCFVLKKGQEISCLRVYSPCSDTFTITECVCGGHD